MQFTTPEAQKVFKQYLKRLEQSVSRLPESMQQDLVKEITGHILDSMNASQKETELDQLLDATARLGEPAKFLKPMIADYETEYATSTFNPVHVFRAMVNNIGAGFLRTVRFGVFFLLYFTLFTFAFLFISKIFFPDQTGLFFQNGTFYGFGVIFSAGNGTEVLGYWILPLSLLGLVLDYLLITFLLKLTVIKRK